MPASRSKPVAVFLDRVCQSKKCGGQRWENEEDFYVDLELRSAVMYEGSGLIKLYELGDLMPSGLMCHRCGGGMDTRRKVEVPLEEAA